MNNKTNQSSLSLGLGGFLLKGLLRDRSRSLLPIIVVALGVMITVFMHAYMGGVFGDGLEKMANFNSGHIRVMTKAYSENLSQLPNDLAIMGVGKLKQNLKKTYPNLSWVERIEFGGMLDVPDSTGKTRVQGNVIGKGVDLITSEEEINRLDLKSLLVRGRFPQKAGEILISDELFQKMGLYIGEKVTLISNTMYNEMAMQNFTVTGTLHFGVNMLDRGMMIADIKDVQNVLNMEDAASSVLGFFKDNMYHNEQATKIISDFNKRNKNNTDKFSPVMTSLSENGLMGISYTFIENLSNFIIIIFIFAMSIVLWNTGLISGLRRYGEFGLRLAIGENKREIYKSLIWEAVLVGIIGSVIGTILGLLISWFVQQHGINMGSLMKNSSMMFSNILRAKITFTTWYIGFIPGLVSTVIGAMLAGIGIYKRQTANLFKELEN
ncbi:Related to lipoprotein releasing system transmembrane protein [uncultured Paludibacter sp.]|nr:Related to lipoprotein releasing system transmembrane protein [uncultured Paludibacter sp.]